MSSKVTIIGGAGFIGTSLCKFLFEDGIDFEIIDLKKSNSFPKFSKIGDVRNIRSLSGLITGDVVINLAAVHRDDIIDKGEYYKTNVLGAKNVVRICTEKQIKKIIFTSSVAVYGFAKPGTDESGEINPFNEYGKTKYAAEQIFREWNKNPDTSLIIVRPTVVFGEGNRGNMYNLLNQISSKYFVMIGKGKNIKSIAYVKNIAWFLLVCVRTQTNYSLFNYIDNPNLEMNELIKFIRKKFNKSGKIILRIPISLGLLIGKMFDLLAKVSGKKFAISEIRVKSFPRQVNMFPLKIT